MSPKINSCKYIRGIIQYHERKVEAGNALCLYAGNFIKDVDRLTIADKLYHFERLISLNERTTKPVVHVLLNFHPSEVILDQRMQEISQEFMEKWGRADKPYLVYRHSDRIQPHVHIVSTIVEKDGRLERLMKGDILRAKQITQGLEESWSLVPSVSRKDWIWEPPGPAKKIDPREMAIYPAMRNVFALVIEQYRYTSLDELNILLRPYNIDAYTGSSGSFLHNHKGLIYRVLDERGKATGSYIRACDFSSKPTLKRLEQQFERNLSLREAHRQHLTTAIDWAFYKKDLSFEAFKRAMEKEMIGVVIQNDAQGKVQNIWYVDHKRQTVFDGNTLGERYNASDISRRCVSEEVYQQQVQQEEKQTPKVRQRLRQY